MKTKQIFTLSCLLLLAITGQSDSAWAQKSSQVQQDRDRHNNNLHSSWNGGGASISTEALLRDPAFRTALGVSDEYYQKILASVRNAVGRISDDPEFQKVHQEYTEAFRAAWGKEPWMNSAMTGQELEERKRNDPEAFDRLQKTGTRAESMQQEFTLGASQRHTAALEEALSPEIKQKIQEAWLAAMGETSTFSPRLFEALYLTDAQKQQMERIKKELEPEFEKHCEIYAGNAAMILERVDAAREHNQRQAAQFSFGGGGSAPEEWGTVLRKLQEEPEHKRLLEESYASSKALATLFRVRMSEILNDEQRKRLQELLDNPPLYARLLIQRLRRENWGQYEEKVNDQSGENKKAESDRDVWVPGSDSWQPGDPIPEKFGQEEEPKGNFPRPTDSKRESN